MLDIDKDELKIKFQQEDWNYVFDKVYRISEFIILRNFKIYNKDIVDDMKQECAENFLKKIENNKVDPEQNVFSFIWKNSTFRILEILRKESKRRKIAYFLPFDYVDYEIYRDNNSEISNRYVEEYAY